MSVRPHPQQHLSRHASKWIIDYKSPEGKRVQETFVGSEADARSLEHSFRIRSRTSPFSRFPSLLEVAPFFVQHYELDHQPKGAERLRWSLKVLLPFFGRYQFPSISARLVEEYKRQRLASGVKHSTINTAVSQIFPQ